MIQSLGHGMRHARSPYAIHRRKLLVWRYRHTSVHGGSLGMPRLLKEKRRMAVAMKEER